MATAPLSTSSIRLDYPRSARTETGVKKGVLKEQAHRATETGDVTAMITVQTLITILQQGEGEAGGVVAKVQEKDQQGVGGEE